jgi:Ribonuclease G/E
VTRRLLLAVSPGEIWASLTEEDEPLALRLVRSQGAAQLGDLHLGRVVALRPELPAALIDIGEDRPGFLPAEDMPPNAKLREGEAVIVKIVKVARADKATGLSMKLDAEERAVAVPPTATPPLLLRRRQSALTALLDDFATIAADEIVIDDSAAFAEARSWCKRTQFTGAMTLHVDATALFEARGVASIIDTTLASRVALPQGGAITIEPSSAAILIDVDGGRAGALGANLAAAAEIARQIRLRDLSGPIVIDFIGMKRRGERTRVETALGEACHEGDEVQLLGWTRLGHFELTRKRRRPSLTEILYEHRPGAAVKTALTVAHDALRQLQRESRQAPGGRFALLVHPEVAACFEREARGARLDLEARLGNPIKIIAGPNPRDSFDIRPA